MTDTLTPILTKDWDTPDSWKLDTYVRGGGYDAARKALTTMKSPEVIDLVKASGLRGRGGAGFPTGMKWSFIPQDNPKPKYLVVNCDESEPGTCKDMPMLIATPHTLLEGIIIACYAVNAHHAFIFCRGEVLHAIRRLSQAVREPTTRAISARTCSAPDTTSTSWCIRVPALHLWRGDRTALRAGGPPWPAAPASPVPRGRGPVRLPHRGQQRRVDRLGAGHRAQRRRVVPVDGHREVQGRHDLLPVGTCEASRAVRGAAGHHLPPDPGTRWWRARRPPAEVLHPRWLVHADVHPRAARCAARLRGVSAAGSILGTKALQVFDETTSVVRTTLRWTEFYKHESCGKCTPCREGSWWLVQTLRNLEAGKGQEGDVDKLLDVCDNVSMKSFCTLADGFVACITSAIKHFRSEFEAGYHTPAWELFPYEKSALFADPDRESITMTGATA